MPRACSVLVVALLAFTACFKGDVYGMPVTQGDRRALGGMLKPRVCWLCFSASFTLRVTPHKFVDHTHHRGQDFL